MLGKTPIDFRKLFRCERKLLFSLRIIKALPKSDGQCRPVLGGSFNNAFKVSGAMVQSCHETLRSANQADRLHPRTHRGGSRLRETKNYSCTREERRETWTRWSVPHRAERKCQKS